MKKIVSLLLAMCLLLSAVPALAAKELNLDNMSDTTLVTLTVSADADEFVVVIPSTVEIDPVTQKATTSITLNAGWKLVASNKLTVSLISAQNGINTQSKWRYSTMGNYGRYAFQLKSEAGVTVEYEISSTYDSSGSINGGNPDELKLIEVNKQKTTTTTEKKSKALFFYLYTMPEEGVYTDILTFGITLE